MREAAREKRRLALLTNSSVKCYRSCQRLYWYEYVALYRPVQRSSSLDFGTLIHALLELWWRAARHWPNEPDRWLALVQAKAGRLAADEWELARIQVLMAAYHCRWSAMEWDGEALRVVAVERQYETALVNPATGEPSDYWARGGRLDVVVQGRESGRYFLTEHKSSGEDFGPGSKYRERLLLDSQVSHYHVGSAALGYPIAGCIYDILRRPTMQPEKATPEEQRKYTKATAKQPSRLYAGQRADDETVEACRSRLAEDVGSRPDHYLARVHVVRLAEDLERAAESDWMTAEMMRLSAERGLWPMNPGACGSYGRTCAFFPVCTGQASLDDGTRYRRASWPHEELSGPH